MKTEQVVSSGGVIYKEINNHFEVALILRRNSWLLPKGIIEKNETSEETAIREVKEETGLEGEIVEKIGEITYSFFKGKRYYKTVHFFLLKLIGGSFADHDLEADRVKWFPISKAHRTLTYINEKKILTKAEKILRREISR
jgi:8-oxo-dGTP pyrophosphatase MutT (NUDIX family)